ncbi:hypothetical protein SUSAZ_07500 [Sulfolobus acidocaldarius SUSAZ]|nr:hypothetical protein SUSAZ_07500 [Sulfolobus acidocaldarius SUSAZ]
MKISNVESKYSMKVKGQELLIEETRNEKGEKIIIFQSLTSAKLLNNEEWKENTSDAKNVEKREDLPQDIRKITGKILSLI